LNKKKTFLLRFVGRFEILDGGFSEDASLLLSGGISNKYFTDIAKYLSYGAKMSASSSFDYVKWVQGQNMSLADLAPNVNELFLIFKLALEQKNIVGCYTTSVSAKL
jgi:hypothetical protein